MNKPISTALAAPSAALRASLADRYRIERELGYLVTCDVLQLYYICNT